jgi:hypothetical protein
MSAEAREHSFDELTRGLASGTLSRGKVLRLMGAALVGPSKFIADSSPIGMY